MTKLTVFLILVGFLQISANSYSQTGKLFLKLKDATILEVFQQIENVSFYRFFYDNEQVDLSKKVSVNTENKELSAILKEVLEGTDLTYKVNDKLILIQSKNSGYKKENTYQQKSVKGKVTDESGQPLPGVTVIIKRTSNGTVTDMYGDYSLSNITEGAILQFSFVGTLPQEIVMDQRTTYNVTMKEDAVGIDEVVVVGYGTQMRTKVTGAIAQVDAEDLKIENRPVTSLQTALVGTLPGLRSGHSDGAPGSTPGFDIRGASSTNSTSILVIIDGFEGAISDLDPNSIESVGILKDASAVAVYGARGANGVMLITTKKAQKGKDLTVDYQFNYAIQTPSRLPKTVGAYEYMKILNEAQKNDGMSDVKYSQELLDLAASGYYPETKWPEELYLSNAGQQSHNIAVRGGSAKTGYLINTSYMKQKGLVIGSDNFQRLNLRLRIDTEINKWLSVGTNTLISSRVTKSTPSTGGNDLRGLPFFPVKTDEGEWVYKGGGGGINSVASAASGTFTKDQRDAINVQLYGKIEPIKGLTIEERVSYRNNNNNSRTWNNVFDYVILDETDPDAKVFVEGDGAKRSLRLRADRVYTLETLTLLNYNLNFDKHHNHLMLGFQSTQGESEWFQTGRKGFSLDNLQDLSLGGLIDDGIGGGIGNTSARGGNSRTLSYFGRLNYDYDDKYLVEASFRVDGSSNFSKGNQWGFFPAVSVGWNIARESFMETLSFVDRLKLRASYGQSGDDSGVGRQVTQLVNFDVTGYPIGGEIQPRLSLGSPASQNLKWETATILNLGTEISLWGGKLQTQVEYFINNRSDILDYLQTPQEFGLGDVPGNVYDVKSWGWELELKHNNRFGDIGYWMSFNISDYDNEVTNLFGRGPIIGGSSYRDEGLPLDNRYGYQVDGFFDSQEEIDNNSGPDGETVIDQNAVGKSFVGGFKFVDQPTVDSDGDGIPDIGDGVINADDRIILDENSNQNFYTGFSMGIDYKGFSLSAYFYGVLDRKEWWTSINATQLFPNELAPFEFQTDYWREDNKDAIFPLAEVNVASYPQTNSQFLQKNAYIKLKNITISYRFNKKTLEKLKIVEGLDLFTSIENVGTIWSNSVAFDSGWDPELGVGNADYPLPVTTSFGIKVKF